MHLEISCSRYSDVKEQINNGYYYFYYFNCILIYYFPGGGLLLCPNFNKTPQHFFPALNESHIQCSFLCPSVALWLSGELGETEFSGFIPS